MTSLTDGSARLQTAALSPYRTGAEFSPYRTGAEFLKLLPAGDGWTLVGSDGKVVFDALGVGGRRRCLEFARTRGVLALLS